MAITEPKLRELCRKNIPEWDSLSTSRSGVEYQIYEALKIVFSKMGYKHIGHWEWENGERQLSVYYQPEGLYTRLHSRQNHRTYFAPSSNYSLTINSLLKQLDTKIKLHTGE